MANFTNTKINKTYQRVVQVDGGVLQDGLGNTLSGSMNDLTVDGRLAITGHSDVSASISRLDNFSASLDATFATDAQLETGISPLNNYTSSADSRITSLEGFSSSLDATFATDAEVSNAVNGLNAATSSYAIKTQISGSFNQLSSSIATRFDNIVHSDVSGLNAATGSYAIKTQISGSFNVLSSSIATRFDNIVHSDVTALNAFTGSIDGEVTALMAATASYAASSVVTALDGEVTSIMAATSSYALITGISGSSDILSASLATRVDSLVASTSSYALLDSENKFTQNQDIAGTLFASSSKLGSHHWGGQMFTTKGQFNDFNLEQNRDNGDGTDFSFFKSRGTPGNETSAHSGDEVYNLRAYAYKSGSSSQGSSIMFSDYEFVAAISTEVQEVRPQSASGDIKFTVRDIDRSINTVTIDSSGNISSSNDISASSYYGDGSQLNNLPNTSGQLPAASTYLVPAFINGTPGGTTSLTASAGIYKCMYSGANGTHTVELPNATSVENTYRTIRFISDNSITANDIVQLSGSLGQTIDGSVTYDIDRNYEGIMIWSDGSNWFRIQSKA